MESARFEDWMSVTPVDIKVAKDLRNLALFIKQLVRVFHIIAS